MTMMSRLSFLSLALLLATSTQAEVIATPSKLDQRTRSVPYEAMEVYYIKGFYGYFTRIEFAPEETDIIFALGDDAAWTVLSTRNNVLLKPKAEKPDTNMTVITNKRSYNFVLSAEDKPIPGKENAGSKSDQQFLIRFTYPREEAAAEAAKRKAEAEAYNERQRKEREEMEKQLEEYQIGAALRSANNQVVNIDYFGCGADEVLPIAAYDNKTFTFLKFAAGQDIPSFFIIDGFGDESLVNYNVQDDWIVIQRTANEFILRNGKYVGCLVNANRATSRTESGTVSPAVKRRLIPLQGQDKK